jgi:hypothetical protein
MRSCRFPGYLSFYLSSRSRFDIHSPFVYKLYSQVLKDRTPYPFYQDLENRFPMVRPVKYYKLLYRLTNYLDPETILFTGDKNGPEQVFLLGDSHTAKLETGPQNVIHSIDLAFIDLQSLEVLMNGYFSNLLQHTDKETVFIIWNLRESGLLRQEWKEIRKHPDVKVTIDLFQLGLVFFRDELSKEDFVIHF